MKADLKKHILQFISPGGTSRGVLTKKESWILKIESEGKAGYGEVSLIPGLSVENPLTIEERLKVIVAEIESGKKDFKELADELPAVYFALEMAFREWETGEPGKLFDSTFFRGETGIRMNGLVWMNPIDVMRKEANEKVKRGFRCIKFKIGSHRFEEEFKMLSEIRNTYGKEIEIRVDANGAYTEQTIFPIMDQLAQLNIHSIEQPVKPRQWKLMRKICAECAVPVALDEELIGIRENEMKNLLDEIQADYLILKPSLLGGWIKCDQWIELAKEKEIGWWATSALESNIGLNAIAQWVATYPLTLPQGLGTGNLYQNNFPSRLEVRGEELWLNSSKKQQSLWE